MKIEELRPWLTVWASLYTLIVIFATPLYSQTPFYQGKTITIIHGRAPGGLGDLRVRAVIPFLQKYISGNPSFVHEYMDGGGGRKAANFVFSQARADGLNVGNVGGGVVANAILGGQGVQYDLDKMPFIGSPHHPHPYKVATRRGAGRGVRSRQAALHRRALQRDSLHVCHAPGRRPEKSGQTACLQWITNRRAVRRSDRKSTRLNSSHE